MSDLREALAAAGLPGREARMFNTLEYATDEDIVAAYAIDAEAIARVVVERRLAELTIPEWFNVSLHAETIYKNWITSDLPKAKADILAIIFPEAK